MECTLNFATRERMKKALAILDKNPKFKTTTYGRDWSKYNLMCPWSPMFYVTFIIC